MSQVVIVFSVASGSSRMVTTFAGTMYYDPQNHNINLSFFLINLFIYSLSVSFILLSCNLMYGRRTLCDLKEMKCNSCIVVPVAHIFLTSSFVFLPFMLLYSASGKMVNCKMFHITSILN